MHKMTKGALPSALARGLAVGSIALTAACAGGFDDAG